VWVGRLRRSSRWGSQTAANPTGLYKLGSGKREAMFEDSWRRAAFSHPRGGSHAWSSYPMTPELAGSTNASLQADIETEELPAGAAGDLYRSKTVCVAYFEDFLSRPDPYDSAGGPPPASPIRKRVIRPR